MHANDCGVNTRDIIRAGRDSALCTSVTVVERDECQVRCVEVNRDSES